MKPARDDSGVRLQPDLLDAIHRGVPLDAQKLQLDDLFLLHILLDADHLDVNQGFPSEHNGSPTTTFCQLNAGIER